MMLPLVLIALLQVTYPQPGPFPRSGTL